MGIITVTDASSIGQISPEQNRAIKFDNTPMITGEARREIR